MGIGKTAKSRSMREQSFWVGREVAGHERGREGAVRDLKEARGNTVSESKVGEKVGKGRFVLCCN